ncbi:hypothetical protein COV17_00790 [Candidatus Woesearchaeota archaeon CG10_big_fil_rev_8_21_14_0_10_36_11]|nr:MAG: hypothetical protein COV17_00790 [Candidatus Woesearchaeota archaeon CG10_big_fil_rev_8_21_14_0_10_36_11]
MSFNNILCIIKTTEYNKYKVKSNSIIPKEIKSNLSSYHSNHNIFIQEFKKIVKELSLPVKYITTNQVRKTKGMFDLVITCGGDGTFLLAARYFENLPLLGFNSNSHTHPKKGSIGALITGNNIHLETALRKVKERKFRYKQWPRLYVKVNDKLIKKYALNDVYIGNRKPYKSSDLNVLYQNHTERFNCSGMIIATPIGSNAWYRNAGGKPFSNDKFSFLIKDPNQDRQPTFQQGTVKNNQELTIYPNSPNHIISFDSREKAIPIKTFSRVKIGLSKKYALKVIIL